MKVLVTGMTGQDAFYLIETLLERHPESKIYGMVRRTSRELPERLNSLSSKGVEIVTGDLQDSTSINNIIETIRPEWVFHLAAQSHVGISFKLPELTMDTDATGSVRILEAVRNRYSKEELSKFKYYFAATSELFGSAPAPQGKHTPFQPNSPYAAAKLAAYWTTVIYRKAYGMHCSNGLLFNHDSESRPPQFVTRKITLSAARIALGVQQVLPLGNIQAIRDWTHARDMAKAMVKIIERPEAGDYVLGSGESHSVEEFLLTTFRLLGIELEFDKENYIYKAKEFNSKYSITPELDLTRLVGKTLVLINQDQANRPLDVPELRADTKETREVLDWKPEISFEEMIKLMVKSDVEQAKKEFKTEFRIPFGEENKYYA